MTEQPHPNRVRLLPWSPPTWLIDAVIAGLLVMIGFGRDIVKGTVAANRPPVDLAIAALGLALFFTRRRQPLVILAVALAAGVVVTAWTEEPTGLLAVALLVLYTVATSSPWSITLVAGAVTVATYVGLVLIVLEPGRLAGGLLAAIAWPAFAAAAGAAVRQARDNLAQAQERAARAEASRELEARRRVVEERLRIARDVHDLVAHHLAVVNVQSGVATHLLHTDPEAAEAALGAVRSSASTAVGELGQLLGVLRGPGEGADGEPLEPTPDLDAIDDLISSFSASGLVVEHRVTGAPRPLGPTTGVAAYRIIQEALTNAHKHGDGSATLSQTWGDEHLEIEVVNRVAGGRTTRAGEPTSGFGLVGMRERVEAVGGHLSVADEDGWFVTTALLPGSPR